VGQRSKAARNLTLPTGFCKKIRIRKEICQKSIKIITFKCGAVDINGERNQHCVHAYNLFMGAGRSGTWLNFFWGRNLKQRKERNIPNINT
jgi:hypothetical protein